MHDARTGRHLLNLIRPQHLHVAHAVLVSKFALQHIAQNLHIAVRMRSKSTPLRHTVFIDHTQRTIPHVLRIMIVGKRKRMVRIQPSMVGMASLVTLANSQHNASSLTASPAHCLGPRVLLKLCCVKRSYTSLSEPPPSQPARSSSNPRTSSCVDPRGARPSETPDPSHAARRS